MRAPKEKENYMADSVEKKIIIITGSNGFIGQAIAERLSRKFSVIGFDQKIPKEQTPKKNGEVENYRVDISSSDSISGALEAVKGKHGNKIASVVHLAAYYSFAEEKSPKYEKITVQGTEKFLELLRDFEVEQFIFSSTMLVHKPARKGEKIRETSPVKPSWAYPESKVAAENVLKREHEDIPLVNLRIAGVYDDRCHSLPIANQIMRIYEKHLSSHLYPGDASTGQAFLHLDDLLDAIDKIIEKREDLPDQLDLLLGEPTVMTYDELQDEIGTLIHSQEWNALKIPSWFAKFGSWLQHHTPFIREPFIKPWMIDFADDHYDLDISLAYKLLDWRPRHELRQTLPIMIKALQENPLQWYKENKLESPTRLARVLGRMPGDDKGFEVPSKIYVNQLNTLNLMSILWGLWLVFDSVTRSTSSIVIWSEVASGFLVMIFSGLALLTLWQWPRWTSAIIGLWILFAPLALWTESSAAYSTGNLIGLLIIVCGSFQPTRQYLEVPRVLNNPPGWDYNPSAWSQRIPIITLAFFGFFVARYMAAFQLGHIDFIWDPVFGRQTETILKSDISKAFPISDAGLGAFSYLLDAISGIIGDRRRWRTMPWMVVLFGIMIVPPGITSIALVILQPVGVGAWCFLCLLTALIMLLMVAPALDEVVATVQFLRQSYKEGKPFWRTFLRGEPITTEEIFETPSKEVSKQLPGKLKPSLPLGLVASIAVGGWLMFSPTLLAIGNPASDFIYFLSALILTFAIIALSEIARPARFLNIIFGAILAVGIWLIAGTSLEARWAVTLSCIAILALSFPKGKFRKHFGSYDKLARWSPLQGSM